MCRKGLLCILLCGVIGVDLSLLTIQGTDEIVVTTKMWNELHKLLGNLQNNVSRVIKERERDRSLMRGMEKTVKSVKTNLLKVSNQLVRYQKRMKEKIQNKVVKVKIENQQNTISQMKNDFELYKKTQLDIYSSLINVKRDLKNVDVKVSGLENNIEEISEDLVNVKKRLRKQNTEITEIRIDMVEVIKEFADDNDNVSHDIYDGKMKKEKMELDDGEGSGQQYMRQVNYSGNFREENGNKINERISERIDKKIETRENHCRCKKLSNDVRMVKKAILDRDLQLSKLFVYSTSYNNRFNEIEAILLENKTILRNAKINISDITNVLTKHKDTFSEQNKNILDNRNLIKQIEVKVLECNNNLFTYREKAIRKLNYFNKTLDMYKQTFRKHILQISSPSSLKTKVHRLKHKILEFNSRLAHLEVNVLNQTLKQCNKEHIDLYQDMKLREHDKLISYMQEKNVEYKQVMSRLNREMYRLQMDIKDNVNDIESLHNDKKQRLSYIPQLYAMQNEIRRIQTHLPKDCSDVYARGYNTSGVYVIHPISFDNSIEVFCNLATQTPWTVIQRRHDGSVPFNRSWKQYKSGFGSLLSEFWLGNDIIHALTAEREYSLRIDMRDSRGMLWTANYYNFSIGNEKSYYKLLVGRFHGNISDSLSDSNETSFSTEDADHDTSSTNCGLYYTAGWWYKHCYYSNLNGRYNIGIVWFDAKHAEWMQMVNTEMKITLKQN